MNKNNHYSCAVGREYTSHSHRQNLYCTSTAITPLIGRDYEVQTACALLQCSGVRLLTLAGPGGIGKTRLAWQIATEAQASFLDGIYLVLLAAVSEPDQVLPTILQALGLQHTNSAPVFEQLLAFLRNKHILLVLDNFEQVITAGSLLVDVLACCPGISMVVTSRSILRVRGEHEFPVTPLALPDLRHLPDHENLRYVPSISLFVQRAQAVKPDFQLTDSNAHCIAEICVWLDGVPLALELAAVRIKHLSPQALLRRLGRRLDLLTLGRADMPSRQQTLRATLAWSYDLLTSDERTLFRRLALFSGGCTLEQLELFCSSLSGIETPVLDVVASLMDKSLLQWSERAGNEPRLLMLETVREYALECLLAAGEWEPCRQAYALCYIALVKEAEHMAYGPQQESWLKRLEQDYENVRQMLQWQLECGSVEELFHLVSVLGEFWLMRGYSGEGRRFLAAALATTGASEVDISLQAKACYTAGRLAFWRNDLDNATSYLEKCERLYRAQQNKPGIAAALLYLGTIKKYQGACKPGNAMHEESLRLYEEVGDRSGVADVLLMLGMEAHHGGDVVRARDLCEQSLTLARATHYTWAIAANLHYLGWGAYLQCEYETAHTLTSESLVYFKLLGRPLMVEALVVLSYELKALGDETTALAVVEEALALSKEIEHEEGCALALCGLGHLALCQGDVAKTWKLQEECVRLLLQEKAWTSGRVRWILASALEALGVLTFGNGHAACAVKLFGVAAGVRALHGYDSPLRIELQLYEHTLSAARSLLGEGGFDAAWAEGKKIALEGAFTLDALLPRQHTLIPASYPKAKSSPPLHAGLTIRESEVLRLLASGLTNNQIANCLVLSPRTVNVHVQAIYRKLGVISRSAATRYAVEHRIV
ncbi:MAG TPA: LuxR C-terminal-related transcriptional regulator [Ktedonobacteraceae bacterium]|nr:LuxR C-terminal-related transcriptional regulator [Ktedonobacteraceae bacterium]